MLSFCPPLPLLALLLMTLAELAIAFSDVCVDGVVVEKCKGEDQAVAGSLQSLCWGSQVRIAWHSDCTPPCQCRTSAMITQCWKSLPTTFCRHAFLDGHCLWLLSWQGSKKKVWVVAGTLGHDVLVCAHELPHSSVCV